MQVIPFDQALSTTKLTGFALLRKLSYDMLATVA
jgi:hypothetical protein